MKKLLGGVVIAFALFYLLTQPQNAAEVVRGAGNVVGDAFNAVIAFISAPDSRRMRIRPLRSVTM